MTQVKYEFPPNIEAIKAVLKPKELTVFTYGDTIYVPSGQEMPPHLRAHEEAHVIEQKIMGAEAWWNKYLEDPKFRFDQELLAYRAQWAFLKQHYSRPERRQILQQISRDLASKMYGSLIDKAEAKLHIKGEQDKA